MTDTPPQTSNVPEPGSSNAPKQGAKPLTAGQRLSAAKAAKAAKKAARKGGASAEDQVLAQAAHARRWMGTHRSQVVYGLTGAIVVIALVAGIRWYFVDQEQRSASMLFEGVRASIAPLDGTASLDADPDALRFESVSKRATQALKGYRKTIAAGAGAGVTAWAHLGMGSAYLDLGKSAKARSAYEKALELSEDDFVLRWRALEGIGYSFEKDGRYDDALKRFKAMGESEDKRLQPIASYHVARMQAASGKSKDAISTLTGLLKSLNEKPNKGKGEGTAKEAEASPDAADSAISPELAFIQTQAELRLVELDSSYKVSTKARQAARGAAGGGGAGGMDPAQLQELLRKLKNSQGGGLPDGLPTPPAPAP